MSWENRELPQAEGTIVADVERKVLTGPSGNRSCNPKTGRVSPADSRQNLRGAILVKNTNANLSYIYPLGAVMITHKLKLLLMQQLWSNFSLNWFMTKNKQCLSIWRKKIQFEERLLIGQKLGLHLYPKILSLSLIQLMRFSYVFYIEIVMLLWS